jgi:hypothetical protein
MDRPIRCSSLTLERVEHLIGIFMKTLHRLRRNRNPEEMALISRQWETSIQHSWGQRELLGKYSRSELRHWQQCERFRFQPTEESALNRNQESGTDRNREFKNAVLLLNDQNRASGARAILPGLLTENSYIPLLTQLTFWIPVRLVDVQLLKERSICFVI